MLLKIFEKNSLSYFLNTALMVILPKNITLNPIKSYDKIKFFLKAIFYQLGVVITQMRRAGFNINSFDQLIVIVICEYFSNYYCKKIITAIIDVITRHINKINIINPPS